MRKSESHDVSCPTATLALFDPENLVHRAQEADWFVREKQLDAEVRKGNVVVLHAPMGGVYSVRFSSSGLRRSEELHVVSTSTCWMDVSSGTLACADLGCVPSRDRRDYCEEGQARVRLSPGRYTLGLAAISIEEGLDSLPHLVVSVEPMRDGERAPRRILRQLDPWELGSKDVTPKLRRKSPAPASASPRRGPLLAGTLDFRGGIAVFDPGGSRELMRRREGWLGDEREVQEALVAGELVLLRSHGEGFHEAALSVFLGEPPGDIKARARGSSCWGRLRVSSGKLSIGGEDRIPGGRRSRPPLAAWTTSVPNDDYGVEVFVLPPDRRARRAAYALVLRAGAGPNAGISLPKNAHRR